MTTSVINSDDGLVSGTSGLKTTGGNDGVLYIQNNGTTAVTVASTGDTTFAQDVAVTGSLSVAGSNISAANSMGFRNRIINGDMRIDQRNAGAAITSSGFPVDRFGSAFSNDGAFSAQQDSSAPAGFTKSVKCTTTTADASLSASQYWLFRQRIEGFNVADLGFGTANAKTVTLSFWVRSSLTGTFSGAILNGSTNRSYPFTYSISAANTWEQKSVTIPGDTSGTWATDNGNGMVVAWSLGIGSNYQGTANTWAGAEYYGTAGSVSVIGTLNATWYITGVQLEVGSVATEFERRPYGTELALCQRYYWKTNGDGSNGGSGAEVGGMYSSGVGAGLRANFKHPMTMRAVPTATISYTDLTGCSGVTAYPSTNGFGIGPTGGATASGRVDMLLGSSGYVIMSAEL